MSATLPSRPWQEEGIGLYERQSYLVVSDYYSRYLEILHLPVTTSSQVIGKLEATFARYGIPEALVSENGPQLVSEEFRHFSETLHM